MNLEYDAFPKWIISGANDGSIDPVSFLSPTDWSPIRVPPAPVFPGEAVLKLRFDLNTELDLASWPAC